MKRPVPGTAGIATLAAALLLALTGCGGGFNNNKPAQQQSGPASLQVLMASSGDAETKAVQDAAAAWASKTGNKATVTPAQDIAQQLGQAFAGSNPPDVFYVDAARFADYASVGALLPYGDKVPDANDFYESLRKTFTYQGKLYCIPKDFSTIAMEINTDLWTKAGLGTSDVPTTWDQLTTDAQKLKAAGVNPIAIGDTRDRIGAFMVEAGGWIVSPDGTKATANTPQNLQALQYVQSLLKGGLAQYPKALSAGWAGEAFGKGQAAITFEGNWIKGAMQSDYPNVKYTVNPMPNGPKGAGTLMFTQCWGISAKTKYQDAAIKFVEAMTAKDQQLSFAKAFGVMPSRQSAKDQYTAQFPTDKAFIDGAANGQGPVNAPKMDSVLTDFDAGLQQLATTDPQTILQRLQTNTTAAIGG
jgi:multiple sugar transport system substrate-binding protein